MKRALLLNHDFTPLRFISDFDAVILFYKGRAEVIDGLSGELSQWNESFNSPSTSIRVPATMRLLKRITKKWKQPRFRRNVLFNRDEWRCQFCDVMLDWNNVTIDHLLPSSRGGITSWFNCVTACKLCNKRKANRTPEEAGMCLLRLPSIPSSLHFWDMVKSSVWHDDWDMWISSRE